MKSFKQFIEESVDLEEALDKGFYFWDTYDKTIYHEGGRYDSYKDIKKVNTDDFFDAQPGADIDNSLVIGYSDGNNFFSVNGQGKPIKKLS